MKLSVSILESDKEIQSRILKSLLPEVKELLNTSFRKSQNDIKEVVASAIRNSPEYVSLQSGVLKSEFGLDNSSSRLKEILDFWSNLTVEYKTPKISGNSIVGGFSVSMIRSDYSDAISLGVAKVTTDKGQVLPWLQWLLLFADKQIIKDYEVKIGSYPNSRSGNAVMKKNISSRWGVPPTFAGSIEDNWITRSIDSVENDIYKILEQSLG